MIIITTLSGLRQFGDQDILNDLDEVVEELPDEDVSLQDLVGGDYYILTKEEAPEFLAEFQKSHENCGWDADTDVGKYHLYFLAVTNDGGPSFFVEK